MKVALRKAFIKKCNRKPNAEEKAEIERSAKKNTSRSLRKGGMTICRVNRQISTQNEYARSGHTSNEFNNNAEGYIERTGAMNAPAGRALAAYTDVHRHRLGWKVVRTRIWIYDIREAVLWSHKVVAPITAVTCRGAVGEQRFALRPVISYLHAQFVKRTLRRHALHFVRL